MIAETTDTQTEAQHVHTLPAKDADTKSNARDNDKAILAYVLQQPDLVSCYHPLTLKIAQMIALPLYDMGKMLVRVRLDSTPSLQIMIENLDGSTVTIDDCSEASHAVSAILDVEDPIDKRYRLEISSAGIDRPLTHLQDFTNHIGDEVKIELLDTIAIGTQQQRKFSGYLENVTDDIISIRIGDDSVSIAISQLRAAKLKLTDALLHKNTHKEEMNGSLKE